MSGIAKEDLRTSANQVIRVMLVELLGLTFLASASLKNNVGTYGSIVGLVVFGLTGLIFVVVIEWVYAHKNWNYCGFLHKKRDKLWIKGLVLVIIIKNLVVGVYVFDVLSRTVREMFVGNRSFFVVNLITFLVVFYGAMKGKMAVIRVCCTLCVPLVLAFLLYCGVVWHGVVIENGNGGGLFYPSVLFVGALSGLAEELLLLGQPQQLSYVDKGNGYGELWKETGKILLTFLSVLLVNVILMLENAGEVNQSDHNARALRGIYIMFVAISVVLYMISLLRCSMIYMGVIFKVTTGRLKNSGNGS